MQLEIGDVLRVPIVTHGQPATMHVFSLVIDNVCQTAEGRVHLLRDRSGPAVCVREARLRWLQCRFERVLQGIC